MNKTSFGVYEYHIFIPDINFGWDLPSNLFLPQIRCELSETKYSNSVLSSALYILMTGSFFVKKSLIISLKCRKFSWAHSNLKFYLDGMLKVLNIILLHMGIIIFLEFFIFFTLLSSFWVFWITVVSIQMNTEIGHKKS